MRPLRGLAASVAIALALHAWTPPSGAANLVTAGWWWRAQTGTVGLPPPPHVPENGLAVGNGPNGPSAVAAVRFSLQAGEIESVLTLVVAELFAAGNLGLVACPAGSPWFGIQAGAWEERPEAACSVPISGVEAEDGTSWKFGLSGLSGGGLVDVVILPAEGSDPFEMSFEPPTAASLQTTPAPTATEFDSDSGTEGDGFTVPASGFDGDLDFGRPLDPGPAVIEPDGTEAPPDTATSDRREFVSIARPGAPAATESDPRLLAIVILLAALGTALALRREPLPSPRLLGPMADRRSGPPEDEEVRGLGRFRRPRRGAAPSLN